MWLWQANRTLRHVPDYAWIIAAVAGFAIGFIAAGYQHLLYREQEFKDGRLAGGTLLFTRIALGLGTALALGLAFRPEHYDAGPALATSLFLVSLLVMASTDFERKRLPDKLMYPSMLVALALCWVWPERSIGDIALGAGIALALAVLMFVFGLVVGGALGVKVTPFGLGDVKLIVLMGLLCGWPAFLTAVLLGALSAGLPSLAMLISGRRKSTISYGPYLIVGCCVVMLWPGQFIP